MFRSYGSPWGIYFPYAWADPQDDLYGNIGGNEAKPGFTDPEDPSILKVLDITGTKSGCGYMVY